MQKYGRVKAVFLFIAVGLFLLPAVVLGKTDGDLGSEFNTGGQWIWALFSLLIVVALSYWATRFFAGRLGISQARHIKVAESLFLGPNRHLYLLLVHEKVLLVGSSEHGLNLLQEIEDPAFYAELEKVASSSQVPGGKFARMVGPILNGLNPRGAVEFDATGNRQRLQEGLAKIRAWKTKGRGPE